jgi:hypothetical protein
MKLKTKIKLITKRSEYEAIIISFSNTLFEHIYAQKTVVNVPDIMNLKYKRYLNDAIET